jgi:hypothetical protein
MHKSLNLFLDFTFWCARNNHFRSWATIHFQPKLCEMLNIWHRQTTVDHPESNGAVKRLHRRLKEALRTRAAALTWSEELPFLLLGLCGQPREDTGLSPYEAVFGAPIVLQMNFCRAKKFQLILLLKIFKNLDVPAFSLPRHNSSTQLPSKLPAELLLAPRLGSSWQHHSPSLAALRWPLHRSALRTPLLHHPSQVPG